jgi:catechol 2,3-dioxygenase-like lactoylglutathione lyase family enzyme
MGSVWTRTSRSDDPRLRSGDKFDCERTGAKIPKRLDDVPEKHAGFTHMALKISDIASTEAALVAAGVPITGRRGEAPVNALFVRDPDGNVLELAADWIFKLGHYLWAHGSWLSTLLFSRL